jgi:hypothetical protein
MRCSASLILYNPKIYITRAFLERQLFSKTYDTQ